MRTERSWLLKLAVAGFLFFGFLFLLWSCSTKNLIGTEKVGSLFVNSNVPGATIELDDDPTGKQTPDTLKNIEVGRHKVSVTKEGYFPKFDTVEVREGRLDTVNFFLTNKVGAISVDSDPQGAQIILDQVNTEKITPDTLDSVPVGEHIVSVEKEGYRSSPEFDAVEVVEDSLITVDFVLEERLGDIFVNSVVSGGEIILDHVSTGKVTPDTIFDVMVGDHTVSVTRSGYSVFPESTIVEVIEDSMVTVDFLLSQNLGNLSVNSTPQEAEIYLNHENTGALTPDSFSLPEGSYIVSVAKSGYSVFPESVEVQVIKDSWATADFVLTEHKGSIFVNSTPSGGNIILDHVLTGKTTPDTLFDIPAEDHVVSVEKSGYLPSPESLIVTVFNDQTSLADFILLDTLYGSLSVSSNINGATVCIDNQPAIEVTPHIFFNSVPVGTRIISIFKEGHANETPAKEIVSIATGDTAEVYFTLTPAEVGKDSGDITPDFNLQDDYWIWHRFYAYRGFVTIINFWAEDCPYCMEELPYLQDIYTDYLADSLIIFGINYEDSFEKIREIRDSLQLTFTLLKGADTDVMTDYEIIGTPVTIFLDRGGRIYYYHLGFKPSADLKFREKLDELFGK